MKTVLVTSAVTFVPNNYDGFVLNMANDPHIHGLVVIDNRSWDVVLKALLLILSFAAPKMGWTLIANHFNGSLKKRQKAFEAQGKIFTVIQDINSDESINYLKSLQPDLILNARTRSFFRKNILQLPRLGCINIHHGLLPHQRGLLCDFWAHLFGTPSGFSIHQMTSKLDDGSLLKVVEVKTDKKDYLESLKIGAEIEAQAASATLQEIAATDSLQVRDNPHGQETVYRSNPHLSDFYKLRRKGVRI